MKYTTFVKQEMAKMKSSSKPASEKMKAIAAMWRAMPASQKTKKKY
jgi:hypothetical protein